MKLGTSSGHQPATQAGAEKSHERLQRAFDLCVRKTRNNIKRLADEPKAAPWAVDGERFAHPGRLSRTWQLTSSFFTGMAIIAWRDTEDE